MLFLMLSIASAEFIVVRESVSPASTSVTCDFFSSETIDWSFSVNLLNPMTISPISLFDETEIRFVRFAFPEAISIIVCSTFLSGLRRFTRTNPVIDMRTNAITPKEIIMMFRIECPAE